MSFIIVPKDLFNPDYNTVSAEAKLLYGLLADRSKLSMKNGDAWLDQNKNYFVYYPIAEIAERFSCCHDKASRLLKELECADLIQRTRQGLGKPSRVVVKPVGLNAETTDTTTLKFSILEHEKSVGNNTYTNNTDNHTESTLLHSKEEIEKLIKKNVCYDVLAEEVDITFLNSIIAVIVQTLCTPAKTIQIAGQQQHLSDVYCCFTALNDMHIRYVIERIADSDQVILSPKGYILRHLFYADQEMDIYYATKVERDERRNRV